MPRTSGETEHERRVIADVAEYGAHVVHIEQRDDEEWFPTWSFTVGLWHTYGQAEVILFAGPHTLRHTVLNGVLAANREGRRFGPGDRDATVWAGFEVGFTEVPYEVHHEYVGYAQWFYDGERFPLLQMVAPDPGGVLPGEPGFDERFSERQPLLGPWPPAAA